MWTLEYRAEDISNESTFWIELEENRIFKLQQKIKDVSARDADPFSSAEDPSDITNRRYEIRGTNLRVPEVGRKTSQWIQFRICSTLKIINAEKKTISEYWIVAISSDLEEIRRQWDHIDANIYPNIENIFQTDPPVMFEHLIITFGKLLQEQYGNEAIPDTDLAYNWQQSKPDDTKFMVSFRSAMKRFSMGKQSTSSASAKSLNRTTSMPRTVMDNHLMGVPAAASSSEPNASQNATTATPERHSSVASSSSLADCRSTAENELNQSPSGNSSASTPPSNPKKKEQFKLTGFSRFMRSNQSFFGSKSTENSTSTGGSGSSSGSDGSGFTLPFSSKFSAPTARESPRSGSKIVGNPPNQNPSPPHSAPTSSSSTTIATTSLDEFHTSDNVTPTKSPIVQRNSSASTKSKDDETLDMICAVFDRRGSDEDVDFLNDSAANLLRNTRIRSLDDQIGGSGKNKNQNSPKTLHSSQPNNVNTTESQISETPVYLSNNSLQVSIAQLDSDSCDESKSGMAKNVSQESGFQEIVGEISSIQGEGSDSKESISSLSSAVESEDEIDRIGINEARGAGLENNKENIANGSNSSDNEENIDGADEPLNKTGSFELLTARRKYRRRSHQRSNLKRM